MAVKTTKRILRGNVNPLTVDVDTRKAICALMSHRNTPHQDSGLSPAEMLYGCRIRDHLPNMFRASVTKGTESKKANLSKKEISKQRRTLKPLNLGDYVSVQNQYGNQPKKWSKTGVIVEVMPHRQYKVLLDNSRHMTLRNRRFLRRIAPPQQSRRKQSSQQQRFSSLRPRKSTAQTPQPTRRTSITLPHPTTPLLPANIQSPASERLAPVTPNPPQALNVELTPVIPFNTPTISPPQSPVIRSPVDQTLPSPQVTESQPLRRSKRSNKGQPAERLDL